MHLKKICSYAAKKLYFAFFVLLAIMLFSNVALMLASIFYPQGYEMGFEAMMLVSKMIAASAGVLLSAAVIDCIPDLPSLFKRDTWSNPLPRYDYTCNRDEYPMPWIYWI